jgi:hypothetical protein
MLAPNPTASPVWPITGDVPDLLDIVQAQMETIEDQEALLHAYQGVLNAAQAPPPATGTGTSTGTTTLTVSAATGVILIGATITGTGVPTTPPTTITGGPQGGGNGSYTTSVATTLSAVPLTFTPGGGASPWPIPQDSDTLNLIVQAQTAVIRNQTALLQQYQDVLNTSQTPAPPTGP